MDENANMVEDDVEADFILFWLNCVPMTSTMSKVQFIFHVNLGGSLPGPMRAMIGKKQAGLIDTIKAYFAANPAVMDESFNRNQEKIMLNIEKQKDEREAKLKAAEDKKLRHEAKAKRLEDAKAKLLEDAAEAEKL